jgi:dihydrofolate reductase
VPKGKSTLTFVTDGIISVVKQAKAAAGAKNVYVLGGANTAQRCLGSGLLDEMQIHLVPVLLGDGARLFDHIGIGQIELVKTRAIDAPGVSHLRFRVIK